MTCGTIIVLNFAGRRQSLINIHMANKIKRILSLPILVSLLMAAALPLHVQGQSYVETFGQNRIQSRKFDWKYFDTKHFRVYHYDKAGRGLGRYVAEEAENTINVIEKKLGGQFPKRFDIILYNSYDEYRQTNVGLKDESQLLENTVAGTVNLVGDKLVVYYTGQHTDLRHQIRSGMARVVMERMIFGESFKKMVKSAMSMNLPAWVTDGYIAYLVDGWTTESNSEWKRLMDAQPNTGFYELSEKYPELAGKAFWKFISEQYGNDKVKSLLYAMQQKTSVNKSMKDKSNLGMKVTRVYDSCMNFYRDVYAADFHNQELPDSTKGLLALKVPKDNTVIRNIKVSPRGSDVAYVAWRDGQYTVFTQHTAKDQTVSPLLEGGQKDLTEAVDPNYPLMAWSQTGYKLAILYKVGDQTKLRIYNSLKGKIENFTIKKNRFDRVLGMSFMQDDDKLVFSAVKKSQTDLYEFTIKGSKMVNITDDAWDDIEPSFVSGGSRTGILFLSNRPKPNMIVPQGVNQLPTGPMNVYFYNTKTQRTELMQCSDVNTGHVSQPVQYGFDNFAYLYDGNGIVNKYVVLFARNIHNQDSAYSVPVTNYNTSIISHQYNLASGDVADVVQEKDKYRVYFHELMMPGVNVQPKKLTQTTLSVEKPDVSRPAEYPINNGAGDNRRRHGKQQTEPPAPAEVKSGTAFQTEFTDTTPVVHHVRKRENKSSIFSSNPSADSSTLSVITDSAYVNMKPATYRASFKPDFFTIRLDNSILFSQYESYAANAGQYTNPSLSALTTVSLNELMEDHRFTFGFQLPIDLSGSTFFVQYQNFKKRMDWGLLFFRTATKPSIMTDFVDQNGNILSEEPVQYRLTTNMMRADFSYPLDRVRSIRFQTALRQDRSVVKSTDIYTLASEGTDTSMYTTMSRLEYVFDNTISPQLNIRNGMRFKVYAEYMRQFNGLKQSCYNIGLDARNYQKLYKNAILATRLAYAHSDGSSMVEYQLGGVDNWYSPKTAEPSPQSQGNYGFIALATSMRGYKQAAFKGNNFAVLTNEVRLPVLTTFLKRPIQSPILKNLQAVGFVDLGSAWNGFLPQGGGLDVNYTFVKPSVSGGNQWVSVSVPGGSSLAMGYGGGLRTTLYGYFIRTDVAWHIGGSSPIFYVALGTDF